MQKRQEYRTGTPGRMLLVAACALALLVALSDTASAQYLDPGTGSYMFQLLIAGGTAVLYFLYRNKERLTRFLGGIVRRKT